MTERSIPFRSLMPLAAVGLVAGAAAWLATVPAAAPRSAGNGHPSSPAAAVSDPLPSWNDGPTKRAILQFLDAVVREGTETYVPVPERVAVFDHDGTLVCEKPIVHGMFLVDWVRKAVGTHPEYAQQEPYSTVLSGDIESIKRLGKKFLAQLTFDMLSGVPEEELENAARAFLATSKHPVFGVPYADVTYEPMKELIALLRSRGFTVWICSGSGVHFMRPAALEWYGIGPEHVIASRSTTEMREVGSSDDGKESPNRRLALVVQPELEVLNDEDRKPVSIGEHIGRRPIFAAGNVGTGGDIAMLRWSQSSRRPNLQLVVLHDDADREMAYGEPNDATLDAARQYGWHVVRMASDWRTIFSPALTAPSGPPDGRITTGDGGSPRPDGAPPRMHSSERR